MRTPAPGKWKVLGTSWVRAEWWRLNGRNGFLEIWCRESELGSIPADLEPQVLSPVGTCKVARAWSQLAKNSHPALLGLLRVLLNGW